MITLLAEPGTLRAGAEVALPADESHHLRVRRGRDGDRVLLADGEGSLAEGEVRPSGRVAVMAVRQVPRPVPLVLAVGAGDKDRWGWLVEKAAELGVTDLLPVETERTAGVASRVRSEHLERLRRRALEAIKQSGAAWAPAILPPVSVAELAVRPSEGERWIADPAGDLPEPVAAGVPVAVAVGPEGGFTEGERHQLLDAGWRPIRLGPHVLRFETAAIAAALAAGARR